MRLKDVKRLWKRGLSIALSTAMAVTMIPALSPVPAMAAEISETAGRKPGLVKAGSIPASEDTITQEEPFANGTAGSDRFRIPCLITLENGDLLSVADARWTTVKDGGGLDTIASVSSDGGETWNYSFPLYFPDSDGYVGTPVANPTNSKATTIIDPGIVEGPDGTVYIFVDVNPTNCTTLFKNPMSTGTGYVTVNGKRYLALTKDYGNVDIKPTDAEENLEAYPYYVDDFDDEGYARIRRRDNGEAEDYAVDRWYNIYSVDENGEYQNNLTQKQIIDNNGGTNDVDIQQNCFYENSMFHVYRIGYIWMIASKDHGRTWEAPRNINDQVKRRENENAILVSPGRGITTSDGTIVMGFYNSQDGEENASLIWSDDNGETWKRSNDVPGKNNNGFQTSENEIVELSDGTLRMFLRNTRVNAQGVDNDDSRVLCYADAVRNEQGDYEFGAPVEMPEVSVYSKCNLSAITYSKKINGKQAVLLACPTGGARKDGKIFTLLINEDKEHSMELVHTFSIPARTSDTSFAYSCLTELEDGSIGILWEVNSAVYMYFDRYEIDEIVPDAFIEGISLDVELVKGETYTRNYSRENFSGITKEADEKIAEISVDENGISITGIADRGYTEAVIDGVQYKINVTDDTIPLTVGGAPYEIADARTQHENLSGDAVTAESVDSKTAVLYDHVSDINNSLDAFLTETESEGRISEAEFTFTSVDDEWQIYNENSGLYLTINGAVQYFESTPVNINASKHTGSDTFKLTNGKRTALFYAGGGMVFDAATSYTASESLNDKLTIWEKQQTVSADDVIPGYKAADQLKSGNKYLISYIYNGNVIVLYPVNGKASQTKLVNVKPSYKVIVTAQKPGTSSVTVDTAVYRFKVTDGSCRHTETVRKGAVAAGCFTEGYTGDLYCANPDCGIYLEEGTVIPAIGHHDWNKGIITREVTETENGEVVYTCKNDSFHTKTKIVYASVYADLQQECREINDVMQKPGLYTKETIEEFTRFYEEHKAELTDKSAGYRQMHETVTAFQAAKAALERKSTDALKEELQAACREAEPDYRANETNLGTAWTEFMKAYIAATAFSDDADDEELWQLIYTLDTARTNLLVARKEAANKKPDPKLKNGDQATDAAGVYIVTDAVKREVTLVKGKDTKNVKIPAEILVNSISCKVTAIGGNAFKDAKNVKKVIIGDCVTDIGSQAFSNCKKLSAVTLGANVKTIGKKAFFKCKKLKTITLQGTMAPSIGKQSFKGTAVKVTVKASKLKKAQRKKLLSKMKSAGKISKKSVVR